MKQKDMLLIVSVVILSAIISLVASSLLISSPKNRQQQVEVVEPITADFQKPDSKYFNNNSIDPTQLIQIGNNSNPQPFNAH